MACQPLVAQRLDGCTVTKPGFYSLLAPAREPLDDGLRASGIALTAGALKAALGDPRPEVRSLAALRLKDMAGTAAMEPLSALEPLMQAWLNETDQCTAGAINLALAALVSNFGLDAAKHPGGQQWVTPFRACKSTEPAHVKLILESASDPGHPDEQTVQISARNETGRTLPFLKSPPEQVFSVTVLDPVGAPVSVLPSRENMLRPVAGLDTSEFHRPMFVALPPGKDFPIWTWSVGEDFDLSAPGTYTVSLGGELPLLNATICSNTATLTVGN